MRAALPVLLLSAALLAGCASPARIDNMVVTAPQTPQARPSTYTGALAMGPVTGGTETLPFWTSEIGDNEFAGALRESLRAAGLLATDPATARYRLDAQILNVEQPVIGFDMRVNTLVNYRLIDPPTGATVWSDTISATYTADFSSSLVATLRVRLANEGAARENIRKLIERLQSA
jgi:hypothetical protein